MLRKGNTRPLHWADKTMSVLRADQLEACEKDLAGLPVLSLFDPNCTDQDAEALYDDSFYCQEDRMAAIPPVLHTVDGLQSRVLSALPAETLLLSPEEHQLLIRLILFGGRLVITDWNDLIPARSMIRRLWCRGEWKNETLTLFMPHQLCASALLLLAREDHKHYRELIEEAHTGIDNTLYLMGMMQASGAVAHIESLLKDFSADHLRTLILRMLQTSYDYIYDKSGNLVLIHPGLADPDRMMREMADAFRTEAYQSLSFETMNSASDSVSDLENPLYEQMLFSLEHAVRPEITPEDAVEDLIILAKQGVSYQDMQEVLASLLVSLPDEGMLKALRSLNERVPRWLFLSSAKVQ